MGRVMRRMARGALLGARGNSGVIVSQILRGMADTFATMASARGGDLARALRTASEAAYAAVARPVEGTVLSVVAAAAEGAGRIKSDDLITVARAAALSAAEALARTPQQLPVLARAGVVDAGGRGLVVLLDALVEALSDPDGEILEIEALGNPERKALGTADYGYEVQYLLDATPAHTDVLRATLDGLGDSLVVVGTGEGSPPTWNVHVHVDVDHIGAAIEAGLDAGRPYRISVMRLEDHLHDHAAPPEPAVTTPAPPADPTPEEHRRGAVVVAAGDGLTSLFADEGAVVVGRNPSTAEMLSAIAATRARQVVLLPNDANTHAVATSAAREAADRGVRVSVVPTRSPVQALASLAVRDPGRRFDDDVIAMAEAAGACRYGEVTTAAREALTVAGRCRPGDLLGLVDGEVHVIVTPGAGAGKRDADAGEGHGAGTRDGGAGKRDPGTGSGRTASGDDLAEVSRRLLDRMLGGGGELVSLVLGADAPPALEDLLRAHIARVWPFVEVQCYAGGQPRYHLLVGVE
ncbi:DAK2 domain-containing protein [Couchioplanes caeruleus]|uniref:DAK2 domain-containing protein n=1 Tax=Couchioplanes caeruleus TaxID=56438 RepID=UPI0031F89C2B